LDFQCEAIQHVYLSVVPETGFAITVNVETFTFLASISFFQISIFSILQMRWSLIQAGAGIWV
jgi:hypothetical protein